MSLKVKGKVKYFLAALVPALFLIIAAGFHKDLLAGNEKTYEGLKLFSDVLKIVEDNYIDEVEMKDLIEDAVQGMVNSLDPHSALLPPDAFEDLQVDTQGEFTGIGIQITKRDGLITVISPIEGTPAHKAGIAAGDKIIKVDDKPVKSLRKAVKMIKGPKGTSVVVTILREKNPEPINFTLIRDVIPIESVKHIALDSEYGYIRITNFRDKTKGDLQKALKSLESNDDPLKGLILDLRDNPGGLLSQAIQVSDLFLENGKILSIKGRLNRNTKEYNARPNKITREYPIVVLINGGSASASEIVAGALQDHKRAIILGTTSFGKGSVQNVEALRYGYGLKLTVARYFTPTGRSIQAKGIEPDIVVKHRFIEEDIKSQEKRQIKEKDLKNHLEAIPDGDKNKKDSKKDKKSNKKKKKQDVSFRYGPLSVEKLQKDNQVMRAHEILISYNLLKR